MSHSLRSFLLGGIEDESVGGAATLALLRVYTGLALALAHGLGKIPPQEQFLGMVEMMGAPAPELFAWMSGIAEFLGGLLLAAGILTRAAAFVIVVNMFVAVVFFHINLQGDPFGGYELALFFFFSALLFLVRGGNRFSVDGLLRRP